MAKTLGTGLWVGALIGVFCTYTAAPSFADEATTPLAEMRSAAEAAADTDPDSPARHLDLKNELRAAVRFEVAREVSPQANGRPNRRARPNKSDGNSGNDTRQDAHQAAHEAQSAKRNSDVHKSQALATGNPHGAPPGQPDKPR